MRQTVRQLLTEDRTRLFVRRYHPLHSQAARNLVIVHGAAEHGGRYTHVAERLVRSGWCVTIADLRGHGQSSGVRTHVADFEHYVDDVAAVIEHFRLEPRRTAMLGHSMGGLVAVRFAQRHPDRLAALVLSSPLLKLRLSVSWPTWLAGRALSVTLPWWRFSSRVDPSDITGNPEALRRRREDPFLQRTVTAGWYFQMKRALRCAWNEATLLQLPLLVVQAGDDRIVDAAAVAPWLAQTASPDAEHRTLPERLHEVLNESDWEQTLDGIDAWLVPRVAGRPAQRQRRIAA